MENKNYKFSFLNYSKISDIIMYFNYNVTLKICVNLSWKSNRGDIAYAHNEYTYFSDKFDDETTVIKRIITPYFLIENKLDSYDAVRINPQDIMFLRYLLDNSIMPWIQGKSRVWSFKENKMYVTGKWKLAECPFSEYSYIAFMPIVMTYENQENVYKEGIRMFMNSKDNFVDIDINKFMEFYYYIFNTDMYNAGSNMVNYAKTQPYGLNGHNFSDDSTTNTENNNNFFDKL